MIKCPLQKIILKIKNFSKFLNIIPGIQCLINISYYYSLALLKYQA